MNVLEVKNLNFSDAEQTSIECEVLFAEFSPEWLPFGARADDPEAHGREIFSRCMSGEFGSVGAYVPPTEEFIAEQARAKRNSLLSASDWTQLPDVPQATKDLWVAYRQALRDVTSQAGFPASIAWPTPPTA